MATSISGRKLPRKSPDETQVWCNLCFATYSAGSLGRWIGCSRSGRPAKNLCLEVNLWTSADVYGGMQTSKAPMKMTISIDDDLRARMKKHEHMNWSHVAEEAFERKLRALEAPSHEIQSLHYANEKLSSAVGTLCSIGSIQRRLGAAAVYNLIYVPVWVLTAEVRAEFEKTLAACKSVKPKGDEGAIEASTSRMTDFEASEHSAVVQRALHDVECRLAEMT